MRVPVLLVVLGVLLVVGVPTTWLLTRPGTSEGPPVAEVVANPSGPADPPSAGPDPVGSGGSSGVPLPPVTTRPATPQVAPALPAPTRLAVPALGIDAPVDAVGVEPDGNMTIPEDVSRVGWYRFGPAPGAPEGSAVLAGHVDDAEQGLGAMSPLAQASVGDRVQVTDDAGGSTTWQVVAREEFSKQSVPLADLFARSGPPRLVLITCGGPFLADVRSYEDNVVVVAEPVA
ncbi:class F sortase [Klenkia sp. PcliD-1-E]|uniref:class F sortase n=1 Tax=Klenkia sp. PcliD-1-E TaxID=2954492 RepID=UPI0020976162|nr:class F sortase [Klenkia sp. PcliD-1-E]MCO7222398.1 sortase [Klenkia sp. PcliD-1-E]